MKSTLLAGVLYFGSVVVGVIMFLKHVVEVDQYEESVRRGHEEALKELSTRKERKSELRKFVQKTSLDASAETDLQAGLKKLVGK